MGESKRIEDLILEAHIHQHTALRCKKERDRLRGENAALREGHQWILDAAKDVREGKTSEGMALIAIEDFANFSLGAVPADARGERERAVIDAARRIRYPLAALPSQKWLDIRHEYVQEMIDILIPALDALDAIDAPPAGREGTDPHG